MDVVITDIIMPKMNGVDAIETIRRNFRRWASSPFPAAAISTSPVICLVHHDDRYLAAAKKAGAHYILTKPFESRELIDAVAQVLAAGRMVPRRRRKALRSVAQPAVARERIESSGSTAHGAPAQGVPVMPLRIANIVMAAALCSCSLRIRFKRCFSTVLGLTPKSRAISLLELPRAIRVSTSRSRSVMDCVIIGAAAR